jgi:hypothetical protein
LFGVIKNVKKGFEWNFGLVFKVVNGVGALVLQGFIDLNVTVVVNRFPKVVVVGKECFYLFTHASRKEWNPTDQLA